MKPALEDAIAWAQAGVKMIADSFTHPGDDFAYVLLLLKDGGELILPLEPELFSSRAGQQRLAQEIIPDIIREHRPRSVAMVVPAWEVSPDLLDAPLELVERGHGDDAVLICAASAENFRWLMAPVTRIPGENPTLGTWVIPGQQPPQLGEAMRAALREIA